MIDIESQLKDVIKIFGSSEAIELSAGQGNRIAWSLWNFDFPQSFLIPNDLIKIT